MAFRKTFYESLEQLQRDLDQHLAFYDRERAYQGYRTQLPTTRSWMGSTPSKIESETRGPVG